MLKSVSGIFIIVRTVTRVGKRYFASILLIFTMVKLVRLLSMKALLKLKKSFRQHCKTTIAPKRSFRYQCRNTMVSKWSFKYQCKNTIASKWSFRYQCKTTILVIRYFERLCIPVIPKYTKPDRSLIPIRFFNVSISLKILTSHLPKVFYFSR